MVDINCFQLFKSDYLDYVFGILLKKEADVVDIIGGRTEITLQINGVLVYPDVCFSPKFKDTYLQKSDNVLISHFK